jgi:hypothetical protein
MCVNTWSQIVDDVIEHTLSINQAPLLFRGHADASWSLKPSLARVPPTRDCRSPFASDDLRERGVYWRFRTEAGVLLPAEIDPWSVAFAMQHHELPTRLLDWTDTFAIALHFALRHAVRDAAVWILNPFELNRKALGVAAMLMPQALDGNYFEYYIAREKEPPAPIVAVTPLRHDPRIFNQRGGFTLHSDLTIDLSTVAPSAIRKFVIPTDLHEDARRFLRLTGISEFRLFPDLDGLARELFERSFAT